MCEYARACPVHVRVAMMCLLSVVDTYLMHAILYWLITFLLYKHSMGFRPDPSLPARVGYARLIYLYYMTSSQSCFQCMFLQGCTGSSDVPHFYKHATANIPKSSFWSLRPVEIMAGRLCCVRPFSRNFSGHQQWGCREQFNVVHHNWAFYHQIR